MLTKGPPLVTVDHGDNDVRQDVGWRSFLMLSLIIDVEEGVADDDRVVGQEARANQLLRILVGEIFSRKFWKERGFSSEACVRSR